MAEADMVNSERPWSLSGAGHKKAREISEGTVCGRFSNFWGEAEKTTQDPRSVSLFVPQTKQKKKQWKKETEAFFGQTKTQS